MTKLSLAGAILLACIFASTTATAKSLQVNGPDPHGFSGQSVVVAQSPRIAYRQVRSRDRHHRRAVVRATPAHNLITVQTAAGLPITVDPTFAPKIQGFISDLVASGYKPPRVTCYSTAKSHVRNSNHFWGGACDFNQGGWNKTDRPMYHVAALARKWGLRDGCTFRDCGHIDMPRNYARLRRPHYASAVH